ncbi:hypothetical protein FJU30_14695 [Affinibrenneria salicis]|uniref:Porin n=1 Tax=Affinibrenneria salicis TaxID=2590031 RepID=A0A5J5FYT8_9GAMM|nr:oligogalacturonate-specific porin KdgM family protein [Affinibrenneria salicis]KAA8998930.1 hypothetical protein FJU30_14695 [Affinibrenneria salicis]
MSSRYLLFLTCCFIAFNTQAVSVAWEHEFADVSRAHTDKFSLEHRFSNGAGLSGELEYEPRENEDGSSGKGFRHLRNSKKELGIDYQFDISPYISLTPGLTTSWYDEKTSWKPAISADWHYNKNIVIASRYRYEITDYDNNKPGKHTHRIDIGAKYKLDSAALSYKYTRYFSDRPIFDKKDTDYKHAAEIKLKLLPHWQYILEVSNESVAKNSPRRQTCYSTGFKYSF